MVPTVGDCARAALASLDTDAGLLRTAKWVSERYRELSSRTRLRHLQRFGEVVIPAPVTVGTATFAIGSNIVTGDATAGAVWNTDMIGRHFRGQVSWYEIVDVVPSATAPQLILLSPYSESVTGSTGYFIVQRYTPLVDNVRFLGQFVHGRRRRRLNTTNKMVLDYFHPRRHLLGTSGPRAVADIGVSQLTRQRQVEMYPYPNQVEMVSYQYWMIAPDLTPPGTDPDQTPLPNEVDLALLKQGVLVDLFRYEMAKLMHNGQIEASALMRNEARAQATTWESAMMDMIRADRGTEDVSFILNMHPNVDRWCDPILEYTPNSAAGGFEAGFGGGGFGGGPFG